MPLPVIGTMTFTILPALRGSFGLTHTDEMRFTGLEAGVVVLALTMVTGSAWGLSRRLAEYR